MTMSHGLYIMPVIPSRMVRYESGPNMNGYTHLVMRFRKDHGGLIAFLLVDSLTFHDIWRFR